MTVMGAAAVAGHLIAGVPYPEGRTAIYWIPILTFAFALMASSTRRGTLAWCGCWLLIGVALVNTAGRLQVSHYADWPYDAADREIIARIEIDRGGSTAPASIGGSWQFEPALNFYRVVRHLDWMQPVNRRTPARGDDYYVLRREDAGLVDDLDLRVLFRDPESGTTLAAPRAR
jgi:hypothetical protein